VEDVVRRAQTGDALAMHELMRDLMPYVTRICGAIALDAGEDAVQETFVAVLRHLRSLREPAALRGWVRRIAVHEAVKTARRRAWPTAPAELPDTPEPAPDVATALDVQAAMGRLSPEQRAVLVLRDVDGMSEEDAAEILRLPVGTVKSRLHRARAAFRERWSA
jgi:RNA polymerase sigma factor (sigma-70 family)